jgi:hypothetical protein
MRLEPTVEADRTVGSHGLGRGEASTIFWAALNGSPLVLVDEIKGRRVSKERGLIVIGCVDILRKLRELGEVTCGPIFSPCLKRAFTLSRRSCPRARRIKVRSRHRARTRILASEPILTLSSLPAWWREERFDWELAVEAGRVAKIGDTVEPGFAGREGDADASFLRID